MAEVAAEGVGDYARRVLAGEAVAAAIPADPAGLRRLRGLLERRRRVLDALRDAARSLARTRGEPGADLGADRGADRGALVDRRA